MNLPNIPLFGYFLFFTCLFVTSCSDEPISPEVNENSFSEADALARKVKSGVQTLDDGSKFYGEMVKGVPNGYGKKEFLNGDVYEGQFKKGLRHGHGTLRIKKDAILERYSGMWASDRWDGFGTLSLTDGSRITGKWKDNGLEYGDYQGSDGAIKSGKWQGNWEYLDEGYVKNKFGAEFTGTLGPNGGYEKGFLQNSNGDRYTGTFSNNQYDGMGILEKADGDRYVGGFSENLYSGVGTLREADGTKYSGQFKEGNPHGFGILEDSRGIKYSGEWQLGLREGFGSIDFGDGTSYVGQFRNGLAYEGNYDWGNGEITQSYQDAEGNWKDR